MKNLHPFLIRKSTIKNEYKKKTLKIHVFKALRN